MAVVDGSMSLVEEPSAIQEIAEAGSFEAMFAPLDLGRGTTPGLALEEARQ
jgi:hypothetical protein